MKEKDRLLGALIGLVGATQSEARPTAETDEMIIRGLTAFADESITDENAASLIEEVHALKNRISPSCTCCASPCGRTTDYDMNKMYEGDAKLLEIKKQLLDKLCRKAAGLKNTPEGDRADAAFLYKGLLYISLDMDIKYFKPLLEE